MFDTDQKVSVKYLCITILIVTVVFNLIRGIETDNTVKQYESTFSKIHIIENQIVPFKKTTPVKEKSPVQPSVEKPSTIKPKEEDVRLLAKIINAEAGNQPYKGKLAVGNVVLNRVGSPGFPNTIRKVIYQKGQFSPVANGAINKKPNEESIKAAKEVLAGSRVVDGDVLFFYNPKISRSSWMSKRKVVTKIGGHVFTR